MFHRHMLSDLLEMLQMTIAGVDGVTDSNA
jgi:hypothetical protein